MKTTADEVNETLFATWQHALKCACRLRGPKVTLEAHVQMACGLYGAAMALTAWMLLMEAVRVNDDPNSLPDPNVLMQDPGMTQDTISSIEALAAALPVGMHQLSRAGWQDFFTLVGMVSSGTERERHHKAKELFGSHSKIVNSAEDWLAAARLCADYDIPRVRL